MCFILFFIFFSQCSLSLASFHLFFFFKYFGMEFICIHHFLFSFSIIFHWNERLNNFKIHYHRCQCVEHGKIIFGHNNMRLVAERKPEMNWIKIYADHFWNLSMDSMIACVCVWFLPICASFYFPLNASFDKPSLAKF